MDRYGEVIFFSIENRYQKNRGLYFQRMEAFCFNADVFGDPEWSGSWDNNYLYCSALEVESRENVKSHSYNLYHITLDNFLLNSGPAIVLKHGIFL
jgi:hypothetical protein